MYEKHFNFSEAPFKLIPNADIFYASRGHRKAFAYLEYGIMKKEGIIVVTGDIGAGKTTLIERLFARLEDNLITSHLSSSQFEPLEMLIVVAHNLGINTLNMGKAQISLALKDFLDNCVAQNKRVLVVIDEVQNTPIDSLEELRMLTNYSCNGVAPIQIALLGQPEFRTSLNSPKLEQLRQRVVARFHLGPLEKREVFEYVNFRLKMVSSSGNYAHIFSAECFPLLYEASRGIPRVINTICDRSLITAFLEGSDTVRLNALKNVIRELKVEQLY